MRTTVRHDDLMVAIETAPAIVEFEMILNQTRVVDDDQYPETPWNHCDGYEHEAVSESCMPEEADTERMWGRAYDGGNSQYVVLQLANDVDYGLYDWLRKKGASRQVAREAVAAARRRTIDQLSRWYSEGWRWYGVRCDVTLLGDEYHDSLWGIDDETYAEEEVRLEIALNVARQLEEAGYTVTGLPEPETRLHAKHFATIVSTEGIRKDWSTRGMTADQWRAEFKRNMTSQNWTDEWAP